MDRSLAVLLALAIAALAVAAPVGADHGSRSNFTAIPHDRQPGLTDATYEQHATSPIAIEYLDYIGASWKEGGFTGCGAANSEVFGIDRGNDDPGTKTDHDLTQHVEETTVTEDRFVANFYEKSDAVGSSTHLNRGDEFVGLTKNCFDNPEQPGWYQIHSSIGGTAPNGTYVEATDVSHYFAICDCSSEEEARRTLGPPPSESTPTSTATTQSTATRTPPADGTPGPSSTSTAPRSSGTSTSAGATAADGKQGGGSANGSGGDGDTGAGGAGDGESAGDDASAGGAGRPGSSSGSAGTTGSPPSDWDSYVRQTPTVAAGPGFGAPLSLVALLVAALLVLRRR